MRHLFILTGLIICSFANPTAKAGQLDKLKIQGETLSYEALLQRHDLAGLSFAIIEDYQITFTRYAGVLEQGKTIPVNRETVFSTASISKPVTATLVFMLVEEGKLDLDSPVNNYLKRWKLKGNEFTEQQPVTLRHLLSHTAGTSQSGFADFYAGDDIPTLLDSLNGRKLPRYDAPVQVEFLPGSDWNYSGGGYSVVQLALEDVTGLSLAALAQQRLFGPLKMTHTTMLQPDHKDFPTNAARVHNAAGEVIKTGLPICPQTAASGMWSTAEDLAAFLIEYQRALAGKETAVISPWVAQNATELATLQRVGGWSAGWMRFEGEGNLEWFSHGGSNTGTGGQIMATLAGGKGIIILANGTNEHRNPVIETLIGSTIEALNWSRPLVSVKSETKNISAAYSPVGRYVSDMTGELVTIREVNGVLYFQGLINPWSDNTSGKLYPQDKNLYALDNYPNLITVSQPSHKKRAYLTIVRPPARVRAYPMLKLKDNEPWPLAVAETGDVDKTLAAFRYWKQKLAEFPVASYRAINRAAYARLTEKKHATAQTLFVVQTLLYPQNADVFDSLADYYLQIGNVDAAKINAEKALALDPAHQGARNKLVAITE